MPRPLDRPALSLQVKLRGGALDHSHHCGHFFLLLAGLQFLKGLLGAFEGFFNGFFGSADVTYSYVSDFDNGLAAQDQACNIGSAVAGFSFGCDLGRGAREVGIAGGDSGGPGFVNGKLASINSYGLTFGPAWGDYGGGLNSGWGEFSGYVPVYIHEDWIKGVVPEPASWAMMISGFGMVGGAQRLAARRRRSGFVPA